MRKAPKNAIVAGAFASAVLMLGLAGCASSTPPADSSALARTELSFNINQCQQLNPGLFKCPAMDKPICNPDYTGTPVECLKVDKNGSILVQQLQSP
jgi:hypothetical protein